MRNFLREYFSFTRSQRNGILVLLLLIVILLILPYLIPLFVQQQEIDFSVFQKEIAAFENQTADEEVIQQKSESFALFDFDPNELDEEGWKNLGVEERTIRTIMNYRSKGGHFFEKNDLLRIYGLDTAKYEQLESYIHIAKEEIAVMNPLEKSVYQPKEKFERKENYPERKEKPKYEPQKVELNTADSAQLVAVNGIGPVLSKRIIKYRNKLGGFVSVNQMLEVYGMDTIWFETIKPSLLIDSTAVKKIPINTIAQEELEKHPYFWKNVAKAICNYRQQHGAFASTDDLKNIYVIDEPLLRKIEPYLTFE